MEELPDGVVGVELVALERGQSSFAKVVFAVVDQVHRGPFSPVFLDATDDGGRLIADD